MRRNPYIPPSRVLSLAAETLPDRAARALDEHRSAYRRAVEAALKSVAHAQAGRLGLRVAGKSADLPEPTVADYQDALDRAAKTARRVIEMGEKVNEPVERQIAASARAAAVSLLNSGVPRDVVPDWVADPDTASAVGIDDPRLAAAWAMGVGMVFAKAAGPVALEDTEEDGLDDVMAAVRTLERADTVYEYDGVPFRMGRDLQEGMLWFRHALGSYRPVILTQASAQYGAARGRELEADGWGREQSIVGRIVLDGSLRGNQLGLVPPGAEGAPLGLDDDPIPYLQRYQQRQQEDAARKEAEKRAAEKEAERETREVGHWFADVMADAAKEAGWGESYIPDTVEAKVVRRVLAAHGIKAKVTVRRYSMASGLDVERLSEQDAEAAARIFPYTKRAFQTGGGIYPHKKEDRSDMMSDYHDPGGFRVAPRYVAEVKAVGAEELRKVLDKAAKKPDPAASREDAPAKPGDLIVRFGFYTGNSVYDVVVVEHPVYGGATGVSKADAYTTLLTSNTFRGKRFATVDVDVAKTYGMAVGTIAGEGEEQGSSRIISAPTFTPKRVMADPAGTLEAVLKDAGIFPNPGTRVLWANTYNFAHAEPTQGGRTTHLSGYIVPGHDRIRGRSVGDVMGAAVASRAATPPALAPDTAGWSLRYVNAPKAGSSWWNVGATDPSGKAMRYGYNPDDGRWARGQAPPASVIQAAVAEGLPFGE